MKKKPKPASPGRKPRDGSAATTLLSIRLTSSEAERMRAAAGDEPLAAWARALLLTAARSR